MIEELFAKWADDKPVTMVTKAEAAWSPNKASKINDVTMVTMVTKEKQQGGKDSIGNHQSGAGPDPTKKLVTAVTAVTLPELLPKSGYKRPDANGNHCNQIQAWPPETQRVFVRILAWFEGRGYNLPEAEALAAATVRELMRRKHGPVALISDLPSEVGRAVGMGLEVFPGAEASWRPGGER